MALARGGAAGGQRLALAEACDVAACDGPGPWSAWLSALGGLGSVQGNRNASTFTYNAGGAAASLDYRLDPRFLVGLSVGYTHGTQWTNSFMGQGWSDTVSVAAYGSFTQAGFYVDALAGFAWSTNQLQRQIVIPNLQPRTANGSAGASQFLGQAEAGYKIGVYAPAQASLTPFARLQVQSVTQRTFAVVARDQQGRGRGANNENRPTPEHFMPDLEDPTAQGTRMQPRFFMTDDELPFGEAVGQ